MELNNPNNLGDTVSKATRDGRYSSLDVSHPSDDAPSPAGSASGTGATVRRQANLESPDDGTRGGLDRSPGDLRDASHDLSEGANNPRGVVPRRIVRMMPILIPFLTVFITLVMLVGAGVTASSGVTSSVQSDGSDSTPAVRIDYEGLEEMFADTDESSAAAGRTAPPVDMPAFDDWYDKDDEYIAAMCEKANKYDSDTEWMVLIDTDLCRSTWFVKSGGKWKACGGYCTIAGKTAVRNPDGSIENAWVTDGYGGWPGPRACTPHGAFKVLEGRMQNANGTSWNVCHYPAAHMGAGADHDCWCHRQHENYGVDPATLPLSSRHQSHGCTRYRNEVAQWIYENLPAHSTVVVFDQINPEPAECDMNDKANDSKVDWDAGNWSTWPGYEPLLSSSYDRTVACGRSSDSESGKSGHISGSKGRADLKAALEGKSSEGGKISDGRLSQAQRRVIDAANSTPTAGASRCLAWVGDVFDNAGEGFPRLPTAGDACRQYCHSTSRGDLKPGMIIAVESTVTAPGVGHIGIYMGNGQVRDNETSGGGGIVVTRPLDEWLQIFSTAGTPRWGWAGNNNLSRK